jgi:hypothetical protein
MRKFALLAAAAAIAAAFVVPLTFAQADGSNILQLGPGQYTANFTHPTGTLAVGGGTISARCVATAAHGNAETGAPVCVTRVVTCPASATSCDLIWSAQESALRGPVAVDGFIDIGGPYGGPTFVSPYNCPQANACGAKLLYTGLAAGTSVQSEVFNIAPSTTLPSVANQISLTVH